MGRHKIKGIPSICISCDYGDYDFDIHSGSYMSYNGPKIIWIQAGDDCEGNSNGNPAANIELTSSKIKLSTDDGFKRTWDVPVYKFELKNIEKEIDEELEKYFSQYKRQSMFIKK